MALFLICLLFLLLKGANANLTPRIRSCRQQQCPTAADICPKRVSVGRLPHYNYQVIAHILGNASQRFSMFLQSAESDLASTLPSTRAGIRTYCKQNGDATSENLTDIFPGTVVDKSSIIGSLSAAFCLVQRVPRCLRLSASEVRSVQHLRASLMRALCRIPGQRNSNPSLSLDLTSARKIWCYAHHMQRFLRGSSVYLESLGRQT